ncbi:programmed cell death protein 4 isoform X2 [Cimex lectularius]|uniref:Programmed cell death protein 4 n=1 Tax=Cimex lectularius TaxID=79782 RepID=A0A8I6S0V6_CIMLE|nr:programmed cell death protein 4 isoform X2 [Cimex lectularius]
MRSTISERLPRANFFQFYFPSWGAGGKGVWGKLGSELEEEDLDRNDPNYDSDSLDNGDIELTPIIPEASDEELRNVADLIIREYYEHGDTNEVIIALEDLNFSNKKHMIPQLAIEIAFDHKPSHREMTSVLVSDLYGRIVKQRDIATAFDILLANLPDLILDTPDAPVVLGNFLARAIADDCIPPKVIQVFKEKADTDLARQTLQRADTLLSMKHGLVRLDNVWGVGGGLRPVKYLIRQMNLLLQEYLSSGDLKEATRCLLDLEVPHFHHELVYEVIVMTLEALNVHVEEAMCKLLKSMCDAIIITPDMMERGFCRVYDDIPDILLDVPLAATVLERFIGLCHKAGIISDQLVKRMPFRGRKRFVSEGDGGRIKELIVN